MKHILLGVLTLTIAACSTMKSGPPSDPSQDPYIWLEDRTGQAPLEWVQKQNEATLGQLLNDPNYAGIETEIRKIVLATDRLPMISLIGDQVYNFWQDDKHVRGIWRRTSLEGFRAKEIAWETVIDVDALAAKENENWVWHKHVECMAPQNDRCLVSLSRGGKDADVVREFSLKSKDWVANGFVVPEAKSDVSWIDQDHLYVSTDYGPGTLSTSGYPIVTKLWKRGTPLAEAKEVFRGEVADVSARVFAMQTPKATYHVASRHLTFFTSLDRYIAADGKLIEVPLPQSSQIVGADEGRLFYLLRETLKLSDQEIPSGSLVALPVAALGKANPLSQVEVIFASTQTTFISDVQIVKNAVIVDALDNVKTRLFEVTHSKHGWEKKSLSLPGDGFARVDSASPYSSMIVLSYTDFLTPSSLLYVDLAKPHVHPTLAKQSPARFDASPFKAEQWFATSADGTKIPYFIIHKKEMKLNGENPTLQYGYGGFENSMTPAYLSATGKVWLERGGVYVLTNIRGGGEFGPAWHQAALGVNRQKAYDDFIAISEDLIQRKVTSPSKLAIKGGSNGGLLVGATFVQRPDLYKGVLCEVPLLDMIRYPLLGAGSSWIGEYGDPKDPTFRAAILKYSPYQNVKKNTKYPEVFFLTATSDDRVMPSHARKMHALMAAHGYPTFFFENTDGGHAGNANLESTIRWASLEYTYLWRELSK